MPLCLEAIYWYPGRGANAGLDFDDVAATHSRSRRERAPRRSTDGLTPILDQRCVLALIVDMCEVLCEHVARPR